MQDWMLWCMLEGFYFSQLSCVGLAQSNIFFRYQTTHILFESVNNETCKLANFQLFNRWVGGGGGIILLIDVGRDSTGRGTI